MVGVNHINVHRQPRHVFHEQIDRRAAFHGEVRCFENRRGAFEQEPDDLDVSSVPHAFSTSNDPSLRRAVQRLCSSLFPAAFFAAAAHGKFSSSAHRTQSHRTLTRWQFLSSVANTSGRNTLAPSMMLRAASIP